MNKKYKIKKKLIVAAGAVGIILFLYSSIGNFHTSPKKHNESQITTSGCDFLYPGLKCQLIESESIKIWIPEKYGNDFHVYLNKQEISFYQQDEIDFYQKVNSVELISNDRFITFEIPIEIGENSLEVLSYDNSIAWNMTIERKTTPTWLTEYRQNINTEQLEKAVTSLTHASKSLPEIEKALAYYHLGRAHLSRNEIDEAIDNLSHSNRIFERHKLKNKIIDNSTVLVYIYLHLQDNPVKSEQILSNLPTEKNDSRSLFYKKFYLGQLASYLGALQEAENYFHQAKTVARNYDLKKEYVDSEFMYTQLLIRSGLTEKAVTKRRELVEQVPHTWTKCRLSKYYNGLGWAQIKLLESTKVSSTASNVNPLPSLQHSLQLLENSCPKSISDKVTIILNLSKAYYLAEQASEASIQLSNIFKLKADLNYAQTLELIELQGLLALQNGETNKSIAHFENLLVLAKKVKYSEFTIDALVGKAKSYEVAGLFEDALTNYKKAERLIFDEFINIPMTSSQPYFLSSKMNFSYAYVDLLMRLNKTEEAMTVARRFRARWVDSIHRVRQRSLSKVVHEKEWIATVGQIRKLRKSIIAQQSLEWSIPFDQVDHAKRRLEEEKLALSNLFDKSIRLVNNTIGYDESAQSKPSNGELFLFFYAINDSFIGFASNSSGIKSHTISFDKASALSAIDLANEWITIFKKEFEDANKVKVFPFGLMKKVDFQTLPYKNDILLAHKSISYGVDLKILDLNKKRTPQSIRSLIVANSLGDLKETEKEARTVAKLTKESDWNTQTLTSKQVIYDSLKSKLEKAQHFHYAGHVNRAKNNVFQHHFPLSNNTEMDGADILMLRQVPTWVVLSACNSALNNNNISTQSIGLAHAFIIAGSKKVVATVRPVLDKHASQIMKQFYHQWMKTDDFEQAFRAAQLKLLKTQPEHDWAAFRLVTL